MKILHTADLHLNAREDLKTLQVLVDTARLENCGMILVCGDLFDSGNSYLSVEQSIPAVLDSFDGEILILPGNHDADFLSRRKGFSSNSRVLRSEEPFILEERPDFQIVAVPYRDGFGMKDAGDTGADPDRSILMAHGNYYANEFFYESDSKKYFPIFEDDLRDRFAYAALGHYHRRIELRLGRTQLVNPGSPRVTRDSDTGKRAASVLDTATWKYRMIDLPSDYLDDRVLAVSVFDTPEDISARLNAELNPLKDPFLKKLILRVSGTLSSGIQPAELRELLTQTGKTALGFAPDIVMDTLKLVKSDLLTNPFVRNLLKEAEGKAASPGEAEALRLFAIERLNALFD